MSKPSFGILLQGAISDWTEKAVNIYKKNFPEAQILVSTWKDQNIEHLSCDVIQLEPPKQTSPFQSTINHQIIGTLEGLKKMDKEIIMKCRTDQYINNKDILKIFEKSCSKNQIMISNFITFENIDYWASDLCQIASKKNLLDYWNSIKFFDGTFVPQVEIYLTANYILRGKKDFNPWKEVINKYFCVKDYVKDFQIEWRKMTPDWNIKRFYYCTRR